jgi:hypothetical protein
MKVEPAVVNGALECRDELAAKDATENFDGKKEGVAWFAPAGELVITEGLPESGNKLAAGNATKHVDGKKEPIA